MKFTFPFLINILLFSPLVHAQEENAHHLVPDSTINVTSFFDANQPAEITLKFNIKEFQRTKYKGESMSAQLIYLPSDNQMEMHESVKIQARGTNRKEVCSFPPMRLNIKNTKFRNDFFPAAKKVKIVTHCRGNKSNINYMLREFLAYKIYNILTPYSFKVRLLDIKYIDTGRKNKVTESLGILIEPEKMLAERLDMIPQKYDHLGIKHTEIQMCCFMSVFQYLIGNDDFSISGRHNIKLLKSKDPLQLYPIPIPYDFDFSGIVNAGYANPRESLKLENVKDRYFLGPCRTPEEYYPIITNFISKKKEIYDLINNFEYLSESERLDVIKYLDEFYDNAHSPAYINKYILSTCQN